MASHPVNVTTDSHSAPAGKEKEWFQILAIFSGLSGLCIGVVNSWSSPSIPKIVNDKVNYNITLEEASYFTVLPPTGVIVSSFFFAKLNDTIGRKYTLLLVAVPFTVALIIISLARSVYLFYVARFIIGLGNAGIFSSLPTYVGEITTPKVRGSWGTSMTFMMYLGQLCINVIGSYTSIVVAANICLFFPVLFFCTFIFMPETPYFYLMKDRVDDARVSLQKLRQKRNVEEELCKLKVDVDRQMSESGTWKDLFTIDSNRKALYAGIFLRTSQQFGGISSFLAYTQYIFLKSGSDVSASTSSIIFTSLCASLNLCAAFFLDKIGRRKSYFMSLFLCGIALMCIAIYLTLEHYTEINVKVVNWVPLAGMILFVVFYSFGLGIVPTLMLGELFSASIKGKGLLMLNIVFAVLVGTMTKIFHLLDSNFGLFAPFWFFSVSCFVCMVLALHFVPETRGQTLEEIQQTLKHSHN